MYEMKLPFKRKNADTSVVPRTEVDATVRTTEEDWLLTALNHYKEKVPFVFVDDAGIGITQRDLESAVNLIRAAKGKAGLPWKTITSVLVGLGLSGAGIAMVAAAILDPEPTSKLGLLVAGGILLAFTGGLGTLSALGVKFSITGRGTGGREFKIEPKD
jgi:hypothetical protein